MALDFLRHTPDRAYRKVEADLRMVNPSLDMRVYKGMSSDELDVELTKLTALESNMTDNMAYGEWYSDSGYVVNKLLQEALTHLRDFKFNHEREEVLVPSYTYFRKVKQFGHLIEGEMCYYMGSGRPANWVRFRDSVPVLKALEVVHHGLAEDFRSIYIELADGRADGLSNISVEHITESSEQALMEIEEYCDSRWTGPWPWEVVSPYRLRKALEEKTVMKQQTIQEMRDQLNDLLVQLNEGEAEKFDVIQFARDMADKIDSMIDALGRIAGDGFITVKDKARTAMGDDAAMRIEHAITQPLNFAADALSKLKGSVLQVIQDLQSMPAANGMGSDMSGLDGMSGGQPGMGGQPPMGGQPGGDPMGDSDMGGPPGDEMGGEPGLEDDDMAGPAGLGGVEPERAMKRG